MDPEAVSRPVPGAVDAVEGPTADLAKTDGEATAAPEPLSEEAKAEEKRVKQIVRLSSSRKA